MTTSSAAGASSRSPRAGGARRASHTVVRSTRIRRGPGARSGDGRASGALARAARVAAMLLALVALVATDLAAQYLTRPRVAWRSLSTEHFDFHYPAEMALWAGDVAGRMEGMHEAVTRLVGYEPERRVTVLVEDPSNVSNGFALPFRDSPTIFLWPTPPDPSGGLSHYRDWGEMLAVHEFAHLAHLLRPSRNARQRFIWRLLPVELGPLARRTPRWVFEGYATYVEGKLTGSGRPAGAGRAAVLRQWALEGQLPGYGQLDGSGRYMGGSMAYLAGSAFLEWLVEREGPESLTHLWRRMSAREDRGFDAAFTGVYGAPAAELYGRFTAELTGRALAVEDSVRGRGPAADSLVQRLGWTTGAPALSADGELTAIVLRSATRPPRLVIWSTRDSVDTTAVREARQRQLDRDPDDVPAVRRRPPPRRALHTLHASAGRGYDSPRFLPDGERVIASRPVPQGDGSERPDLFIWTFRTGELRRLTHGAAIRDPDPSPDGRRAAGVRCAGGICDLVRVELGSGRWSVVAAGSPRRSFYRPRWSPDGRRLLVAVHDDGRWRLALVPAAGGEPRPVGPDDGASRYGADFVDDSTLVTTSEAGGIAHLELLSIDGGPGRPLTRTSGAHILPDASPDGRTVQFLALHARGYDLRSVPVRPLPTTAPLALGAGFFPALPPTVAATPPDGFPRAELPPDRPYGLGPRRHRFLPGVVAGAEGVVGLVAVNGTDPVGRLSWLLRGAVGDDAGWRGASLDGELRTRLPSVRATLFATRHQPSVGGEGAVTAATVGGALDTRHSGGMVSAALRREYGTHGYGAGAGASLGRLSPTVPEVGEGRRALAFGDVSIGVRWDGDRRFVLPRLSLHAATGRTGDSSWTRGSAALSVDAAMGRLGGRGSVRYAAVTDAAPAFERLVIGGLPSPLLDGRLLDQRWTMPALPVGVAAGDRAISYRLESSLLGLRPYFWGAAAGDGPWRWHRVVGAEYILDVAPLSFVGLPAVQLVGGVGRSLDAPFQRTRAYLTVSYAP
ncbi:MAG: TolB family protein [Gemmatimonadaceae bacterium]